MCAPQCCAPAVYAASSAAAHARLSASSLPRALPPPLAPRHSARAPLSRRACGRCRRRASRPRCRSHTRRRARRPRTWRCARWCAASACGTWSHRTWTGSICAAACPQLPSRRYTATSTSSTARVAPNGTCAPSTLPRRARTTTMPRRASAARSGAGARGCRTRSSTSARSCTRRSWCACARSRRRRTWRCSSAPRCACCSTTASSGTSPRGAPSRS
mmetsp:Transcript_2684/g.6499  ORF Transcript_2684/g.6499 Transcript_2684/m.6499 type:complete len:217 (-) Transcript_2684:170-820(-)